MRTRLIVSATLISLSATLVQADESLSPSEVDCRSLRNLTFREERQLLNKIALTDEENRELRTEDNLPGLDAKKVESVQGRYFCNVGKPLPKDKIPTRQELETNNFMVENAQVSFDSDVLLINRHMFFNKYKNFAKIDPANCFFEHLKSGIIYRSTRQVQYRPVKYGLNPKTHKRELIDFLDSDLAVVKLEKPVAGADPIKKDEMIIDSSLPKDTKLTVISNFADNSPFKVDSPTVAICHVKDNFLNKQGYTDMHFETDCPTGGGSSASGVYATALDGKVKLYGIVSYSTVSDKVKHPPGSGYVMGVLSTGVSRFDEDLLGYYDKLKAGAPPPP